MIKPSFRFQNNDPALESGERADWIVILPLGAHEQHGPHLPFETDTLIAEGIVDRLERQLPDNLPVTVLPAEAVGYSPEHMHVAGTETLSYSEAIERWLGVAGDLSRKGIHKFVMLNAHGGNSPLMTIVATEARIRFGMLAVATSWTRFGIPEGLIPPEEKAVDIHAGKIETSVMLALHPDKVDMRRAIDFPSAQSQFIKEYRHLRAYGPHAFGWTMADLNSDGAVGNAMAATAGQGELLLAHAIDGLIELLQDVKAFDLRQLR